ncbi:hypothetical protein GJAV_G00226620 [Gymnothorax javanicus]|nr:hypothetical protein GJAV_G00226620 [Gymnothorax javanicus]
MWKSQDKSKTTPVCPAQSLSAPKRKHHSSCLVFADLTTDEYLQVRDYMWNNPNLHISRSAFAKPSEDFIFMIDLQLSKKADVLRYLDGDAARPERRARVVVFHGSEGKIKEYAVGPLPNPKYHEDVTLKKYKKELPIFSRTVTTGEYVLLFKLLRKEIFTKLGHILKESFGVQKDQSLNPFEGMPRGVQAGDRQTWISFFRDMSGMYIHPVGFEVLVNHRSTNASEWIVEKLLYNGQYFESAEELILKYKAGSITKIVYKKISNYASLKPKVKPTGLGPQQINLQGQRFSVKNNQSGSVEAKVHATGYISSSFKVKGNEKHGHQVQENIIGNIHTHFMNFKVDLDVLGVKNVFQTKDMRFEEVDLPWLPGRKAQVPHLVEKQLGTEKEAALRHGEKIPRYLHIASNRTNRWGHQRSYRLQVLSFTGEHLPETAPEESSMSWARYKVAVTKHKDEEESSSSLHSQNSMWTPPVDFSSFIEDNESIVDEDLVAWVTTGFLHIPHAEDIPNTVTVGNGGGVILRPHNYFDQDPSVDSPDAVYIHPDSPEQCENNKMACIAQETCHQHLPSFTYNGFEGVMEFNEDM